MNKDKDIIKRIHTENMKRINIFLIIFIFVQSAQLIIEQFFPHMTAAQYYFFLVTIVLDYLFFVFFRLYRNRIPVFFEYATIILVISSLYPFFVVTENHVIVMFMYFNMFLFYSLTVVSKYVLPVSITLHQLSLIGFIIFFQIEDDILAEYFRLSFLWMIILSIWSYRYFKKTYDEYLSEKSTKKAVEQYKNEVDSRRKKEEELKKINEIKDSIINLNQMLLKENDIQVYFDFILKKAIEIIPKAEIGIIFSVEKDSLKVVSEEGYGKEILGKSVDFNRKLESRIRKTKTLYPVILNRVKDFYGMGYQIEHFINNKGLEVNSFISVPFYINNELYGYMNLKSSSEDAFDDSDKEMMIFFAEHIDLALKIYEQYDQLKYFSRYDQLTGFYNRWHLNYIKENEIERWKRLNISITVMILDFDNLKKINDIYGHVEGDKFFRILSEIIGKTFRSTDVFIRLGGDEFLMIFFEMPSGDLERIMKTVKEKIKIKKDEKDVSCELRDFSYGISVIGEDSDDFDELVKIADNRMYAMKKDKNKKILNHKILHEKRELYE